VLTDEPGLLGPKAREKCWEGVMINDETLWGSDWHS
jgi:hypothetical protein